MVEELCKALKFEIPKPFRRQVGSDDENDDDDDEVDDETENKGK